MVKIFGALFIALAVNGCTIPTPPEPFGAVPSERQLNWHKLNYYAFIHFGPNTFTDVEWGHGNESPEVFNPTELDTRQWASIIRDAGMEGIIITAKHHDGFALWPSDYSTHTVRESAWRDGEGDLLKELSDACREFGLKFGVYVSPWDRNHPKYGTDEYNDVFKNMLEEVLSQYGDVYEVWFDGANGEGPNGKKQVYDFPGFADVVRRLQPNAVIFSDGGPDIRWIGNERGYAAETNWSTVNDGAFYPGIPGVNEELQSGHEDGDMWLPAEVNTSIRPGWFYHADQDNMVKSLDQLIENWYHSVGMNGNFLLNIPVDARGLIHQNDAARLMELRDYLDAAFSKNLAIGAEASASNIRHNSDVFSPDKMIDGDAATYWATDDGIDEAGFTVEFEGPTDVNAVLLQEYITLGQRVTSFSIDAHFEDSLVVVGGGTTIGNRRIVQFPTRRSQSIRINLKGKAALAISNVEIFRTPDR